MKPGLTIENLNVSVGEQGVVSNLSLIIEPGEVHALMGPNGSGKSSLAYAVAGHPSYVVTKGSMLLGEINLLDLQPEERAKAGLFLSFQEPPEVGGISMGTFIKTIASNESLVDEAAKLLPKLGLEENFLGRFLNDGFSGGEKKKSEMLQLLSRSPIVAILDEIDTGLDLDALFATVTLLKQVKERGTGLLVISHTPRIFEELEPDGVHILIRGQMAASGGKELLADLLNQGYGAFRQ